MCNEGANLLESFGIDGRLHDLQQVNFFAIYLPAYVLYTLNRKKPI